MSFENIKKPAELLALPADSTPYRFANFIRVDGFFRRRLAKRKLRVLKASDAAVRQLLRPGEEVFFLTDGIRTSLFEQFFIGWAAYFYNYMAFAFTNQRVIFIHLKGRKKRGAYLGQLEYDHLRKITVSMLGSFILKLTNGSAVVFGSVPRSDGKYLKNFLNSTIEGQAVLEKGAVGIEHLCPRCFSSQTVGPKMCPSCGLALKTPRKAALLSLLMPGLGDIYLGSQTLGSLELAGMLFLWFTVGQATYSSIQEGADVVQAMTFPILFFLFLHPIDALKAHHMGKKGLLPVKPIRYSGEGSA